MRLTVSSTQLSSRLNMLVKVINSKNSMPILDCFLFDVMDGQLYITASDSENTIKTQIMLDESDVNGSFCISNRTILDAVKELPEQPITIDVDLFTMKTTILYTNGLYNIVAQPADEYPRPTPLSDAITVTMQADVMSGCITRSLFATANEELRPVMNGVYFDLKADGLAVVASDGHKLVRNIYAKVTSEEPVSFILPKKPASLLKNIMPKDDSEVSICFNNTSAEISFSDTTLTCRPVEGKYPNYNSVIPQNNTNCLTVDRKAFLGALKRVLPFASDQSQQIRLRISNGKMEVSSEDIDFSTSAREEVICEYSGTSMSIGFKGSTLTEVLNNLESEEIMVKLSDPARAGLIVPVQQPEDQDILMLLMPMLLND